MRLAVLMFSTLLVFNSCSVERKIEVSVEAKPDSVAFQYVYPEPFIIKDSVLDAKANFFAGITAAHASADLDDEKNKSWEKFKRQMDKSWGRVEEQRLQAIEQWRVSEFAPVTADSLSVFYPFGGPDFLHAQAFYPHANEFILVGLEPIRELPDVLAFTDTRQAEFLDTLSRALRDILFKSYFITEHMQRDFKTINGVLPVFFFFIKRSGHELMGLNYFTLDSVGQEVPVPIAELYSNTIRGVRISFRKEGGGSLRNVYYFNIDLSDKNLLMHPGFLKFIQSRKSYNTFVKSASYLMHYPEFSMVRDALLSGSKSIFQDDTGVPFRFISGDRFTAGFYGDYEAPVRDFNWLNKQKDLDSAFQASRKPMPFSIGYHWNSRRQHYMLFLKR